MEYQDTDSDNPAHSSEIHENPVALIVSVRRTRALCPHTYPVAFNFHLIMILWNCARNVFEACSFCQRVGRVVVSRSVS